MKYGSRRRVRPKNQTSSPIGWLCMRVWRVSLLRTKNTIISWDGSFVPHTKGLCFMFPSFPLFPKPISSQANQAVGTIAVDLWEKTPPIHKQLGFLTWATSWENLFMPYANNKGADQPAHPRSLISTFIVCCLDSVISLASISEISGL